MIVKCDQCDTKFKLDDTKVSERGTKVRCSKCKHIFIVQKEIAHEEPDLDSLLSGLGNVVAGSESIPQEEKISPTAQEEWPSFAEECASAGKANEKLTTSESQETAGQEFGDDFFASNEETPPVEESSTDFGEISFTEEQGVSIGAAAVSEASTGEKEGFDFGEFSFENEINAAPPSLSSVAEAVPAKTGEFDFEEFSFTEEKVPALAAPETTAVESQGFDFGPSDFEAVDLSEKREKGASLDGFAEDVFTFGEEPVPKEAGTIAPIKEPALPKAIGERFDFESVTVPSPEHKGTEIIGAVSSATEPAVFDLGGGEKGSEAESFDFGKSNFGEAMSAGPAMAINEVGNSATFTSVGVTGKHSELSVPFPVPSAEEELPPLSIATRKKGSAAFPLALTAIILIVSAIAAGGFYFFKDDGSAAFGKLGLGFLAKWLGAETVEEGGIAIRNPVGAFMTNQEAGEIFAVSGEAVNNFKKPRTSIQVKATILGPKGEILRQRTAYCGNVLSKEQLATFPMAKIERAMGNQLGDSLANLGVQPGKEIPFVIVFSGVPKEAAEFGVTIVGSTVATQ
jgi:predicted Zn finger-like uncharacterized protein